MLRLCVAALRESLGTSSSVEGDFLAHSCSEGAVLVEVAVLSRFNRERRPHAAERELVDERNTRSRSDCITSALTHCETWCLTASESRADWSGRKEGTDVADNGRATPRVVVFGGCWSIVD